MHKHILLAAALLGAGPAHAARNEVSFDFSHTIARDSAVGRYFGSEGTSAYGIRGGWAALRDRRHMGLVLQAGWRRSVQGAQIGVQGFDAGRFTMSTDTFSLGLKGDYDVAGIFFPYVSAHVELVRAGARLEGSSSGREDVTRVARQALAPAGSFVGGFEIMIPDRRLGWPVTAAWFLELGYQASGRLVFDDLGDVRWGGAVVHTGLGLRF